MIRFLAKKPLLLIVLFAFLISAILSQPSFAQKNSSAAHDVPRPKLVVGIVVDQMRWDYLYRYYGRYGNDGFKRMLKNGFSAGNTNINYVPTYTAIGHTSIYTGSVPAIHGIDGNNFYLNHNGKLVYCTEDDQVQSVGTDSTDGQMSPKNLLTTTITDELQLATNFRSKVIGIALKDRASILPAGRAADAAYWFDDTTGNWVTSTWYMKELPDWVKQFNQQNLAKKYLDRGWNTLYPISSYAQSTPDNNDYERALPGTDTPIFPVDTAKLYKEKGAGIIRSTPFGNAFTFDMARAAIKNEELGRRDVTDFLAISLSSTDYVGHYFGPNSIEVEDTYLRLDQDLANFLTYLDQEVGKGKYTVFLTADHGASHNIGFMEDHHLPAGAWNSGATQKALNSQLESVFGAKDLVRSLINSQVHFNHQTIEEKGLDFNKIEQETVRFLEKQDGVAYAVIMADATNAAIPAILRERIVNSYNRIRSGAIQIILQPAWYSSGAARPKGATHSAIYPYDTHIPLVFMGWGIKRGETAQPTNMTDIAPTLAALLHIQTPDGSIGTPISEALKLR